MSKLLSKICWAGGFMHCGLCSTTPKELDLSATGRRWKGENRGEMWERKKKMKDRGLGVENYTQHCRRKLQWLKSVGHWWMLATDVVKWYMQERHEGDVLGLKAYSNPGDRRRESVLLVQSLIAQKTPLQGSVVCTSSGCVLNLDHVTRSIYFPQHGH